MQALNEPSRFPAKFPDKRPLLASRGSVPREMLDRRHRTAIISANQMMKRPAGEGGPRDYDEKADTLECLSGGHHGFGRDAELFEDRRSRRAQTEAIDADHFAVQADVFMPEYGDACFDRDALAGRQS